MTDENIHSNSNFSSSEQQNNSFNNMNKKKILSSEKNKNVEPLPESSRPRRDGPGGENGD